MSASSLLFIFEILVWMLFTYSNFKFSNPFNFIVISAYSSLSNSFRKSLSSSRIEDGCDALFFAIFRGVDVRVIIKPFCHFHFFLLMFVQGICFSYHAFDSYCKLINYFIR